MSSSLSSRLQLAIGAACAFGALGVLVWWQRRRRGLYISKLCVYPIKSCRGLSLGEVMLTFEGLAHDREYAVIKVGAEKTMVLTQREVPLLATISTDLPTEKGITVYKFDMESLYVAAMDSGVTHAIEYGEWDSPVAGVDQGDSAAAWFCEALQDAGLRFVRFSGPRATPEPERFGSGLTRFSDGFTMLLSSEASLAELSERSHLTRMMARMRPNVVIAGCEAYAEDTWAALRWEKGGATVDLMLKKPCARCTIPRIDPLNGVPSHVDPVSTLKSYRSGKHLALRATPHSAHFEAHRGQIFFGQNVIPSGRCGVRLRVGDVLVAIS